VVRGNSAGGNYAVDMRMKLQALIPTVKHAEETDLGSKMPWIAGDFKQGLSALRFPPGFLPASRPRGVSFASPRCVRSS
jgi:hypothetical protein